ncbi:MAG: hypothetical protein ACOH2M_10645 [Cypionkella sp.]
MLESNLDRASALRPIVIEVAGEPQGIVVPHEGGYRFVAVRLPAFAIDGHKFETVEKAHFAVKAAVTGATDAA